MQIGFAINPNEIMKVTPEELECLQITGRFHWIGKKLGERVYGIWKLTEQA